MVEMHMAVHIYTVHIYIVGKCAICVISSNIVVA